MHLAKPCLLRTTPLQFSLQPRILLDITRETGVHIAVGTAPPQDWSEGWVGEGGRMGGAWGLVLCSCCAQLPRTWQNSKPAYQQHLGLILGGHVPATGFCEAGLQAQVVSDLACGFSGSASTEPLRQGLECVAQTVRRSRMHELGARAKGQASSVRCPQRMWTRWQFVSRLRFRRERSPPADLHRRRSCAQRRRS